MTQVYWPGTSVPVSRENAFDWRGESEILAKTTSWLAKKRGPMPLVGIAKNDELLAHKPHGIRLKKSISKNHGGAYSRAVATPGTSGCAAEKQAQGVGE